MTHRYRCLSFSVYIPCSTSFVPRVCSCQQLTIWQLLPILHAYVTSRKHHGRQYGSYGMENGSWKTVDDGTFGLEPKTLLL